jgi:hypothetical protein
MKSLDICAKANYWSQSLETMVLESEKIAKELMAVLTALHVDDEATRFESFLQAIRTSWNNKKIAETKQRLDQIRQELQFRIQVSAREDIIQALDDTSRQVLVKVLQSKEDIVKQQQASETSALKRHEQLIDIFTNSRGVRAGPEDVLNELKERLHYQKLDDRFDDIVEAHQSTFRWVLQESIGSEPQRSNLYDWLRADQGIYWISGKAGSGKSTLMKFLCKDPRLHAALTLWAGDAKLLILRFYFWNAGSDLQKSHQGLFRSLLYQILDQAPSLGSVLFSEHFETPALVARFPSFHELRRGIRRFLNLDAGSFKVAMLIDGLDEFEATDMTTAELAELFVYATRSTHIKALLSSRPLSPFEWAFMKEPQLRLHHLTHDDIKTYVNDKLVVHPRIADLSTDHAEDIQALIDEIVSSASGVFLWVRLVVRSLLEGLRNYDHIPDLQKRLRLLPRDLEALFRHMLRHISDEYKTESSAMFQIVRRSDDRFSDTPSALTLKFAETAESTILTASIKSITIDERRRYEEEVAGRLRSRCVGLLEIRQRSKPGSSNSMACVDYLHKSVADFLAKDDIWDNITTHTSQARFDANTALLRSYIMQLKCAETEKEYHYHMIFILLDKAMIFAKMAEISTGSTSTALLDELDRTIGSHLQALRSNPSMNSDYVLKDGKKAIWRERNVLADDGDRGERPWDDNFLALATSYGLTLYVRVKLHIYGQQVFQWGAVPLLDYACCPRAGYRTLRDPQSSWPELVETLLQHGANPNVKSGYTSRTVWQNALPVSLQDPCKWVTLLLLLVQHGADANVYIEESFFDGKIRRSALRYINARLGAILRAEDPSMTEADRRLHWHNNFVVSAVEAPTHFLPSGAELSRLRLISEELVQLLTEKGAREEEWHQTEAATWRKVFSETPSLERNDQYMTVCRNSSNGKSASTQRMRSPFTRIRDRMQRSLSRTR